MATRQDLDLNNPDLEKKLVLYEQGNGLRISPYLFRGELTFREYRLQFTYADDGRKFEKDLKNLFIRHHERKSFERVCYFMSVMNFLDWRFPFAPRKFKVVLEGIDSNGNKYERVEDFDKIRAFYFPNNK